MTYIPPTIFHKKFTCPHCHAISNQKWQQANEHFYNDGDTKRCVLRVSHCDHCQNYTLWHKDAMVYPDSSLAPLPNPDMPSPVRKYYDEAASIASKSPRAAAGLLRLAIQVLCKELGEPGENINADIGSLVKKGLHVRVQQALDVVRVTGNNAVHPGTIDTDDAGTVSTLFSLVNVIVDYMISMPKTIEKSFGSLPSGVLDGIAKRDAKKP